MRPREKKILKIFSLINLHISDFLLIFATVLDNTLISHPRKSPEEVQVLGLTGVVSINNGEV